MENAKYILCYTREPQDDMIYSNRLAFSMHLAYSEDGKDFSALNHNSGVLFARATENEDKTLNAKSLKCPFIFSMEDGLYGVVAVRTDAEGENDIESKGKILFFTTADFLQYDEIGLIDLHTDNYVQDVACVYDPAAKKYLVYWRDEQQRWYRNETADMFSLEGSETNIHCEGIDIQSVGAGIQGAAVQSAGNAIQGAAVQSTGNAIRDAAVQNTGNAIWDAAVQSAGNAIQDAAVQVTGAEVQDAQTAINGIRADIEGIIPRNILKVPAHIGTRLKHKLTTPVNIRVEVPDESGIIRDELTALAGQYTATGLSGRSLTGIPAVNGTGRAIPDQRNSLPEL